MEGWSGTVFVGFLFILFRMIPLLLACLLRWLSGSLLSFSPIRQGYSVAVHKLLVDSDSRLFGGLVVRYGFWLYESW